LLVRRLESTMTFDEPSGEGDALVAEQEEDTATTSASPPLHSTTTKEKDDRNTTAASDAKKDSARNGKDSGDDNDEDDDEDSVVVKEEEEEEETNTDDELDALANSSSQGSSSITLIEKSADDESHDEAELGAQSQVPRGFMERMFWNESDVQFRNNTDQEVLFIIADEEFTLQRTSTVGASLSNADDDDDVNNNTEPNLNNLVGAALNGFGLNFVPLTATINASTTTTETRQALRTRCMPVAPRSHSTQHFQSNSAGSGRLTYVTALTKDADGDGQPWTRVHYENKVINSQRTKSLQFSRKHLKISAYRVPNLTAVVSASQQQQQQQQQRPKRRLASANATNTRLLTNGDSSFKDKKASTRSKRVKIQSPA